MASTNGSRSHYAAPAPQAHLYPPAANPPRSYRPSQAGSMISTGVPAGYPGVSNPHPSMSHYQSGNFARGSMMGQKSFSRNSLVRQSRSLGASKASLASQRSGKTSIQQEYHDSKLRGNLMAPYYGKGRTPFLVCIGVAVLGALFCIAGGTVLGLRFHNNIMLSIDKGEIVGPILIACGIGCFAGALKLYYDAYMISSKERKKIKFAAANESMISINTVSSRQMKQPGEALVSGTASMYAVTRTPQGSVAQA